MTSTGLLGLQALLLSAAVAGGLRPHSRSPVGALDHHHQSTVVRHRKALPECSQASFDAL